MKVLGIDLGSRAVKLVLLEEDHIAGRRVMSTMHFYRDYSIAREGELTIDFERLGLHAVDQIVSTGYGRNNINVKGSMVINELKAHTYGALFQTGRRDFTLLDIGGQDFKLIKVEKGIMTDLMLNDKCAASSGRYLENMAQVLEISMEELVRHYEAPVDLNSTCAVFAESELIGKIAEKYPVEQLAAGVNHSLFKKIQPLLKNFGKKTLVLTGGVACNTAIRHYLSEVFEEVIVPPEPQLNGAIGCAYLPILKERRKKSA